METIIDTNETFDADGNLIHSEQVERYIPDSTPITDFVNTLTEEQKTALLNALQNQ
jgi:hypothetical protein